MKWLLYEQWKLLNICLKLLLLFFKQVLFYFLFCLCHFIIEQVTEHEKCKRVGIWENPPRPEEPVKSTCKPTEIFECWIPFFQFWYVFLYGFLQLNFKLKRICVSFVSIMIVNITWELPFCMLQFVHILFFISPTTVTSDICPCMVSTSGTTTQPTAIRRRSYNINWKPNKQRTDLAALSSSWTKSACNDKK